MDNSGPVPQYKTNEKGGLYRSTNRVFVFAVYLRYLHLRGFAPVLSYPKFLFLSFIQAPYARDHAGLDSNKPDKLASSLA